MGGGEAPEAEPDVAGSSGGRLGRRRPARRRSRRRGAGIGQVAGARSLVVRRCGRRPLQMCGDCADGRGLEAGAEDFVDWFYYFFRFFYLSSSM